MAKANGIIKIEGTVEDLTFYKKDGKNYVRRKGGISKERIENDANFVRTRENNNEFGHSGTSGKVLRLALGNLVFKAKDSKLSSRLLGTMSRIKNLDLVSARGLRKVGVGLTSAEGKLALKGFDFNANGPFKSVFFAPHVLDTATGSISITDFVAAEQLQFPQGATHVSLQSAVLAIDFETEVSELAYSPVVNLPINLTAVSPTLTPSSVPTGTGVQLFLIGITFYQEINGVQYSLKNESYNVLHVLEVL
ncbi:MULTISPECIES: hypothetical protein [Flavobacterium]|jgi:hypothetical protein|uniref:Uncharacterized protein n=1 Tax=Flavobacterium jumunjinense TaxID=998845 RepID=A0ABV5GJZ2_9FLAO|nr:MULTISPECIES: hypothetical protein [Flavobacterium]